MITAGLQQWNTTMADEQVCALMVSGTVSYLSLSPGVAGGCGFQGAVGTRLKQIVLLIGGALCSMLAARNLPLHPGFSCSWRF